MKPIVFNPEEPFSHFKAAYKQKRIVDGILNINLYSGIVMAALSFPAIYNDPLMLAVFSLFNVLLIGANIAARFKKLDLFIIGALSSMALCMALLGKGISYLVFLYLFFTVYQFCVHKAVLNDKELSRLVGYPHFSEHLANASFVTRILHNAVDAESAEEDLTPFNPAAFTVLPDRSAGLDMESISLDGYKSDKAEAKKPGVSLKKEELTKTSPTVQEKIISIVNIPDENNEKETDVLSLAPPPTPVAPPVFDPQEYSRTVEEEIARGISVPDSQPDAVIISQQSENTEEASLEYPYTNDDFDDNPDYIDLLS